MISMFWRATVNMGMYVPINHWRHTHPKYQGSDINWTYGKKFDTYSLGIILLGIAYRKSIEEIIDADKPRQRPANSTRFRRTC